MALPKIGVIAPHSGFGKIARGLAEELGINLVLEDFNRVELASLLKGWENGTAIEAVVTGETIAIPLRKCTALPVITVQVSGYEIIDALSRARTAGNRVVLAEYEYYAARHDPLSLSSILGIDVKLVAYREKKQLVEKLKDMRKEVDAVVGTADTAAEGAREAGLPSFLIQCNQEAIRDALEKAKQISRCKRKNIRLCHSLQAVLNSTYDGIMAVDERGKVIIFNPVAEKLTGFPASRVLGKPVNQVMEMSSLFREIHGDGSPSGEELITRGGHALVVNRVPVPFEKNRHGLVIAFRAAGNTKQPECKAERGLRRQGLTARFRFSDIVGRSAMIEETINEARRYTRSDAAILITGESGTGKELFAQSIHNESARRDGPFVAINCAALPESLLESELFGYEDGAFTGARKGGKRGLFALANGGTIFLDEIGDLSPALQARLLRVLQQKEVMPVGGQRVIPVDVRVISATNCDLQRAVERGDFRVDLYYRLNVLHLHIPPLRMRMEDLPLLFKHFYQRLAGAERVKELRITGQVLEELKTYPWPGNVRELEGFVERYVALGEEDNVNFTTFRNLLHKLKQKHQAGELLRDRQVLLLKLGSMEEMERQIIEQAVKIVGGGKAELARVLGVSRTTLWKKLKKYRGIS